MEASGIDPRLLSAWIKTQFVSAADIASASLSTSEKAAQSHSGGLEFETLLQMLAGQAGGDMEWKDVTGTTAAAGVPAALDWLAAVMPPALSASPGTTAEEAAGSLEGTDSVESLIAQASARYGVDPSLVKAVIRVESGFDPNAQSHAGAKGLMQLMDATAQSLGVTDSFDPGQNVLGGTRFLSFLLTKYEDNEAVALAAYNAGPGRIDKLGIRTDAELASAMHLLPEETQAYVGKVLRAKLGAEPEHRAEPGTALLPVRDQALSEG